MLFSKMTKQWRIEPDVLRVFVRRFSPESVELPRLSRRQGDALRTLGAFARRVAPCASRWLRAAGCGRCLGGVSVGVVGHDAVRGIATVVACQELGDLLGVPRFSISDASATAWVYMRTFAGRLTVIWQRAAVHSSRRLIRATGSSSSTTGSACRPGSWLNTVKCDTAQWCAARNRPMPSG